MIGMGFTTKGPILKCNHVNTRCRVRNVNTTSAHTKTGGEGGGGGVSQPTIPSPPRLPHLHEA